MGTPIMIDKISTKRYAKFGTVILFIILFTIILCRLKQTSDEELEINSRALKRGARLSVKNPTSSDISICDEEYSTHNETIHLAMVCGGYSSTKSLYVLLKSILFYRTNIIHLHLFVDKISHQILEEIFNSWLVDGVEVSFYNITKYEKEVTWIPNSHYSHRYGLLKLDLISILSEENTLEKVIILDTDMLFLGNILFAWKEFEKFTFTSSQQKSSVFGLVENQSDWYLAEENMKQLHRSMHFLRHGRWPADGRGYNSGLILVDLVQLRSDIDWRTIWRQEAETQLVSYHGTALADQDIFNAVFRDRSWLVHKLPCSFNLQLNDHSRLDELCKKNDAGLQVLHWNSPRKLETTNSRAQLLKNWYITLKNIDAKLFEINTEKIPQGDRGNLFRYVDNDAKQYCANMRPQSTDRLRLYPYYREFDYEPAMYDVTYVVHLSFDRLQALDELAHNWQGPISAAIYLSEQDTSSLESFIEVSSNLSKRKNIGYHLVFRDSGFTYPINRMRNIALNHTVTPYVFQCDVDFLPSFNLDQYLKQRIGDMPKDSMHNKALIVPAFESKEYKFDFPHNKEELKKQLEGGSVSEFRDQIWPEGHRQTNYERWKTASDVYEAKWAKNFEPFILTSRDVPKFDERFIGFGWNKVQFITQLAALDYKFMVLPDAFVIHKIHSPSLDITNHRESLHYKKCIKGLKKAFLHDLRAKHPEFVDKHFDLNKHDDEEFATTEEPNWIRAPWMKVAYKMQEIR